MTSTALILAALVVAAMVFWRRGARGAAFVCALCACLPALTLLRLLPWPAWVIAGGALGFVVWNRAARSAGIITRWSARTRRKAGVASAADIARHASAAALRRRAATVRPSLAAMSRRQRWRLPAVEVGVRLCRTAWQSVWSSIEDVVLIFGGPRVGKTGLIAGMVLDAPGAVLVTSTRTDLHDLCAPWQAQRGPVFVFNAVGLAGLPSTITFDPLTGCADPVTAAERATDMLAATSRGGGGDREFWDAQARRVLAALLHAAALGDKTMRDVLGWVADADRAQREVPALLRKSAEPAFEQDAMQFVSTNDRTRTSITSTVMPALGWLTNPAASAAAQPGHGFDVEQLLEGRATVFLLGAEETHAAPLVCALTGHIAREARRLAASRPSGRLDPPLTLALDEAALISPVPLESWTADMGGRGVTILAAFQSRAQLLARWGEHATDTILNNTGAVMVFGGTRDRDDLQFWSTLAGERDEAITTTDLHGRVASRTVRKVAVMPPAQIANLPAGRVLVIRRGIGPVIGRAQMAWQRRDLRTAAFARRHPALVKRLIWWADTLRRWRYRAAHRTTAAAVAAWLWMAAVLGRITRRARIVAHLIVTAVRWLAGRDTPDPDGGAVDVDAPTVELVPSLPADRPIPAAKQADSGRNGMPVGRWTR